MAEAIPFGSSQKSGLEAEAGAGVVSMNVYTDSLGAVRRRPGLVAYSGAPATAVDSGGIAGLYATDDGKVLAVGGGTKRWIYELENGSSRRLAQPLEGLGRPTFAQTEMLVALAGGGNMLRYVRKDGSIDYLGGDPPKSSHVIASNLRLIANDATFDKTKVRFSDVAQGTLSFAGLETWTPTTPPTAGFFTAEAKPDSVVAIGETTNEIFVWGTNSLQLFAPDPVFIFAPTSSREYGCIAPHSIVKVDSQFFWLDQYRRIVMSDGRALDVISKDIEATLEDIEVVSDCFAFRAFTRNLDAVVFVFPTDGRAFAFQKGSGWAQWSSFEKNWTRLKINAHCYRQQDGVNLVGTTDGFVAQLSQSALTDLGAAINAFTVTGYLDRGTDMIKSCDAVRLALRRGRVTGDTGPQGWLCWRDRPGPWEGRIPVDLGQSGDTEIVVPFYSLGVYRRRQWMFEFSGTEDLVLLRASEDFEVSDQ